MVNNDKLGKSILKNKSLWSKVIVISVIIIILIAIYYRQYYIGILYKLFSKELILIILTASTTAIIQTLISHIYRNKQLDKDYKLVLIKKLYVPYIQSYYKSHLGSALDFTDMRKEYREECIDVVTKGIAYVVDMPELSSKLYEFYSIFSIIYRNNYQRLSEEEVDEYCNDLNQKYIELTDMIFNEYEKVNGIDIAKTQKEMK